MSELTNSSINASEDQFEKENAELFGRAPIDLNIKMAGAQMAEDTARLATLEKQLAEAREAQFAQACKGEYTHEQLESFGFKDGVDGVKVKTRPFHVTKHEFEMVSGSKLGKCKNCKMFWDEVRLLDNAADPGPINCSRSEAVKQYKREQMNEKFGPRPTGGRGGGGNWRGGGRGRGFNGSNK